MDRMRLTSANNATLPRSLAAAPYLPPPTWSLIEHYVHRLKQTAAHWYQQIGTSTQGRPIHGFVIGQGPKKASIISGHHADEPIGSATILRLLTWLAGGGHRHPALDEWTLLICPHAHPDGARANDRWVQTWPHMSHFLRFKQRDQPGQDREFGYPQAHHENQKISSWWLEQAPTGIHLHVNLHGMSFSDGALLLIEPRWRHRCPLVKRTFVTATQRARLPLHYHDRHGEKGFDSYGPGFASTPRAAAMRQYFLELDDAETAALFHDSSMEFLQQQNDCLSLVSELPMLLMKRKPLAETPGDAQNYLYCRDLLRRGKFNEAEQLFHLSHLPHQRQIMIQTALIWSGLQQVTQQTNLN